MISCSLSYLSISYFHNHSYRKRISAHSRRGDLEVLAYNMVQWLSGKLPWEDDEILSDPEKVAAEKNNCMNNIPLFLKMCFGDDAPGKFL